MIVPRISGHRFRRPAARLARAGGSSEPMKPPAIVIALEIGKQLALGLLVTGEAALPDKLDLERVEEALYRRIVVVAACAAHGLLHAPGLEQRSAGAGSILGYGPLAGRWPARHADGRTSQPTTLRVARSSTAAR